MKILLVLTLLAIAAIIYRAIHGDETRLILARRFGPTLCRVIGHRRRGDAVRKIEGIYHSRCRRCGAKLLKKNRDSDWYVEGTPFDDGEDDFDEDEPVHARDGGSSMGAVLLLVGGVAVGALAIGFAVAPHHVQMRETPHKSYAALTRG